MTEIHSSTPVNKGLHLNSKITNLERQPIMFSARPKLEELPFLNKLKFVRQLLVGLKNQKLRKSLYVVTQGSQMPENQNGDILRHEKAKLSVMDLISQEGKFQELSNTIQSNLNKQTVSPVQVDRKEEEKRSPCQFKLEQNMFAGHIRNTHEQPLIISRKNLLASELNKLGHELEQTYFQVEEMEKIFGTLCNFYAQNKWIVDENLKMKEQREIVQEKIQNFKQLTMNNQRQQIQVLDQTEDFMNFYKKAITEYIKQVLLYNEQTVISNELVCQLQEFLQSQNKEIFSRQSRNQQKISNGEDNAYDFSFNLKFRVLRSELQKIKQQKKNAAQNKVKEKKSKAQSNQLNSFSKLYLSEIYTL